MVPWPWAGCFRSQRQRKAEPVGSSLGVVSFYQHDREETVQTHCPRGRGPWVTQRSVPVSPGTRTPQRGPLPWELLRRGCSLQQHASAARLHAGAHTPLLAHLSLHICAHTSLHAHLYSHTSACTPELAHLCSYPLHAHLSLHTSLSRHLRWWLLPLPRAQKWRLLLLLLLLPAGLPVGAA